MTATTPTGSPAEPVRPHVVIVGGGFGGIAAARGLARSNVRVTLVDRRNHHLFQPLLYQVATAALSPADIAAPIRSILRRQSNCTVLMAEAVAVRPDARELVLADGVLKYDHLVLAAGVGQSWFGHDEWAALAPGLKSLEDALEIRRRMLTAFERAERTDDPALREALLGFVVVGGGPTGVELAGAVAEIARLTLTKDFRRIDSRTARVTLLEAGPRILPTFPEKLSAKATARLERMGVTVRTGTAVTGVEPGLVRTNSDTLAAHTVLWAAGVAAGPLGRTIGSPTDRAGRLKVEGDLSLPGHPNIWAIGDLAAATCGTTGKPVPGVAQGALQMGALAAGNILARIEGRPTQPFRYTDKGSMAVIGRGYAVADLGWAAPAGRIAWLMWAVIHIVFLVGFRSRVMVMLHWMWQYLTFQSGARLITEAVPSTSAPASMSAPPAAYIGAVPGGAAPAPAMMAAGNPSATGPVPAETDAARPSVPRLGLREL